VDVVISAVTMREWTGPQALALLREHNPDIPFILLSGDAGEGAVAECLLSGGTDCVDRSRPELLPLAGTRAVEDRTLREERHRPQGELFRSHALYCALSSGLRTHLSRKE
jgi:CheY-like chemotaxis protein